MSPVKTLFLATLLSAASYAAFASENYGIRWSQEQIKALDNYGYSASEASRLMYESNTSCSKKVDDIKKRNQYVCVHYTCGMTDRVLKIDTYTNKAQVDHFCF